MTFSWYQGIALDCKLTDNETEHKTSTTESQSVFHEKRRWEQVFSLVEGGGDSDGSRFLQVSHKENFIHFHERILNKF